MRVLIFQRPNASRFLLKAEDLFYDLHVENELELMLQEPNGASMTITVKDMPEEEYLAWREVLYEKEEG